MRGRRLYEEAVEIDLSMRRRQQSGDRESPHGPPEEAERVCGQWR